MSARYHQRLATCLPLKRATLAEEAVSEGREPRSPGGGLNKPTGPVKPARSGSDLPDRFDRKPVKFKITYPTGSDRLTGRFDRFTGRFDW